MKRNVIIPAITALLAAVAVLFVTPKAQAGGKSGPSIVDIVLSNPDVDGDGEGDFDTLAAAVGLADFSVLDRLSANGQNTVFAPTDDAFEVAFEELETLGIMPGDILANTELLTLILNYHISPGYRDSDVVLTSSLIRMRDGGFLMQDGGQLYDNLGREVGIVAVDIKASNGVVHVLNNVVLPGLP